MPSLPSHHSSRKRRELLQFRRRFGFAAGSVHVSASCVDLVDGNGAEEVAGNAGQEEHASIGGTACSDRCIVDLCNRGQLKKAVSMLNQGEGENVGHSAMVCLIQSCSSTVAVREGMYMHHLLVTRSRFSGEDVFLENMVMRMYDKCGSLRDARSSFEEMRCRNIVSWNMLMGAYSSRGRKMEVLRLIARMLLENDVKPDKVTLITVLGVCDASSASAIDVGMIHGSAVELGIQADVTVGNVLINAYSRSNALEDARVVFERMPCRNIISWNTLVAAHAASPGQEHVSLWLFQAMHAEGMARDKATFMSSLNACTNLRALTDGRRIHFEICRDRLELDVMIGTALVKMYGRCESLADARCIFENMMPETDVILWTTMITAYIHEGRCKEALQFYCRMKQEGVKPNKITFVTVLSACTNLGAYIEGKSIHDCIPEGEVMSDVILSNALIAMYQKCGSFADAERLFFKMPRKDVVSCTAMIAAYAEQGRGFEALSLFERMSTMGVSPDKFAFSSLFDACASISALTDGRVLLSSVVESGVECDRILGNSLISMYGECGIMRDVHHVFKKLKEPDTVSWSAIICAYANHGSCEDVLRLFHGLHEQGLRASKITYISVLCACSHAGAIEVGYTYFASMIDGVSPTQEHYMCLIDLVGRAGCIEEAGQIVLEMPLQPDAISWNTLLGACRVHLVAGKGRSAAEHVLELDQQNEVAHVMLANLYASSGRWDESLTVKKALMIATKEC